MQEWLDNTNILMSSTSKESMSLIAEGFMKISKAKIYKKWQVMIANFVLIA